MLSSAPTSRPPPVPARAALPWVGLLVRMVAAGIWLVAGASKLADLTALRQEVAAHDILPSGLVDVVGYGLPLFEIALGFHLLVGLFARSDADPPREQPPEPAPDLPNPAAPEPIEIADAVSLARAIEAER